MAPTTNKNKPKSPQLQAFEEKIYRKEIDKILAQIDRQIFRMRQMLFPQKP